MEKEDQEFKFDDLAFNDFTDDELETLRLFHEQVMKMKECSVIKNNNLKISVSYESTANNGFKQTTEGPSMEELGYLLLRIRPCLLPKDKIFFERVKSILGGKASNDLTRSYFKILIKTITSF